MAGKPIPPARENNPVGQTARIRRAFRGIRQVVKSTRRWLNTQIDNIPIIKVNEAAARYDYNVDLTQLQQITDTLIARLSTAATPVTEETMGAYEEGTAQSVVNLSKITDDYTRTITQVLANQPYQRRAALIRARVFEEMQGFAGESGRELGRVLSEAVENGLNPRDLKKSLAQRFGVSESRAERIARTEITQSLRRARLDETQDAQEKLGLDIGMLWFSALSPTTRPSHAAKHGRVYSQQEVREFYAQGAEAINCYLPGTMVAGRFVAGSKAHYTGEVFKIVTRSGRNLTVTPNHPIMTDRGMVPAAVIREGFNLVAYGLKTEADAGPGDLDNDHADASIEHVFRSLSNVGHSRPTRVSVVDFHGDARFMEKNIDVVYVTRPLNIACPSATAQLLQDLGLKFSNPAPDALRPSRLDGNRILLPPTLFVRLAGKLKSIMSRISPIAVYRAAASIAPGIPLFRKPEIDSFSRDPNLTADPLNRFSGHVLPVKIVNVIRKFFLPDIRETNSAPFEPLVNSSTAAPTMLTDLLKGHSGLVFLDNVIRVETIHYSGHVYDLQEVSGRMVANGVIASNCKCSQVEIMLDEDGNPTNPDFVEKVRSRRNT